MTDLAIPLTDEFIEAVAIRVAALLAERESAPADEWLNTQSAAEYLDCPKSRIYDLVQLGMLDPRRDGTRLRFKRSDLDAYLETPHKRGARR